MKNLFFDGGPEAGRLSIVSYVGGALLRVVSVILQREATLPTSRATIPFVTALVAPT
jgi:hypothetical protein